MACPLFLPSAPLAGFSDFYAGECSASIGGSLPEATLRQCCNAGYARGVCERAAQSDADAFRFTIKANQDRVVDVAWSSERNHHPVAVGTLTISVTAPADTSPLERQARIYAAAFLSQIGA